MQTDLKKQRRASSPAPQPGPQGAPAKPHKATNISWQPGSILSEAREAHLGQRGCVIWLTGLSGSGKSTIARGLEEHLVGMGRLVYVLDGDNIRHGLNSDLGFSAEDRDENIRRVGELAALLADAGIITVAAFISPYRHGRDRARQTVAPGRFIEILLDAPLEVCEQRDPKGLYRKARRGQIKDFTGIDSPYEPPLTSELSLKTGQWTVNQCVHRIVEYLCDKEMIPDILGLDSKHKSEGGQLAMVEAATS